jgi:multidrug efflux pump subunit AcrB
MTRKQRNFLFVLLALLVVPALLIGLVVYLTRNHSPGQEPPLLVITVEAVYPGANAQVVADTVAEPIEQQVNGVEGMRYMRSFSGNDGSYVLEVHFPPGADLDMAQVLVQNRVALAQPALPLPVTDLGISVTKKAPSAFALVALFSPDHSRDIPYLSRYADVQVRDELVRVSGVGDVVGPMQRGGWRVWPNADQVETADPDKTMTLLDDRPVVLLALYPIGKGAARQLSRDLLDRLADLGHRFPSGIEYTIPYDSHQIHSGRSRADYLLVDLTMPAGASPAQRKKFLERCARVARAPAGVTHVLATTEHPFARPRNRACLVVDLDTVGQPDREKIKAEVRAELATIPDVLCSVADLSTYPGSGYGLTFVVHGPEAAEVRKLATKLTERLRDHPNLSDVVASPSGREEPQVEVVERFNLEPVVNIVANPAGVSLRQAGSLCEQTAREVRADLGLGEDYRLTWLRHLPRW